MNEHTVEDVKRLYAASHSSLVQSAKRENHRGIRHGYYEDDSIDEAAAIERMRNELVVHTRIEPDDLVLDIGCGFGEDATWIADQIGADVLGVNIIEQQLEIATELARTEGVQDRVRFELDDFHELATVPDQSVNVVWALESICHAHSVDLVIKQVRRSLAAGGRIVIADLFRPSTADEPSSAVQQASEGLHINFELLDSLLDTLTEEGFVDVTPVDVTDSIRPSSKRYYWYGLLGYPAYRLKSLLTRDSADRQLAKTARGHRYQYKAIQRDELRYAIISAKLPGSAPSK